MLNQEGKSTHIHAPGAIQTKEKLCVEKRNNSKAQGKEKNILILLQLCSSLLNS